MVLIFPLIFILFSLALPGTVLFSGSDEPGIKGHSGALK